MVKKYFKEDNMLKKINKENVFLLIISIMAIVIFFAIISVQPLNAEVGGYI